MNGFHKSNYMHFDEEANLLVDGHHFDSDDYEYEYGFIVAAQDLPKLAGALHIEARDLKLLVETLANKFGGNEDSYKNVESFMAESGVPTKGGQTYSRM